MMLNLSNNLYTLRKHYGLTREEFAKLISGRGPKILPHSVYNWEYGIAQPNVQTLRLLADHYGTTIDKLCYSKLKINDGKTSNTSSQGAGGTMPKAANQDIPASLGKTPVSPNSNAASAAQRAA
jgi:transcriptional regulator with XRE-family HTH domain